MRTFLLFLALLLLAGTLGNARPGDKLIIGMELAYPPFEMADPQGNPTGISVDLSRALGVALKRNVEIRNLPFDGLIPSLKTGKIDLIISSMTATPERARAIDFSEPYLKTGLCLLLAKDSPIQSARDLDSPRQTIAVKQGTTGHLWAVAHLHSAKILVLDREAACVLEVVQGKAAAFIYDQMSVLKHWQQNPNTTRPLLSPLQEESWAIGIRKGDKALTERINQFLQDYRANGGFDRLGQQWLGEQRAAFESLGVPFVF